MSWDPLNEAQRGLEQPGCSPGVSSSPVTLHKESSVLLDSSSSIFTALIEIKGVSERV